VKVGHGVNCEMRVVTAEELPSYDRAVAVEARWKRATKRNVFVNKVKWVAGNLGIEKKNV